MVSVKIKVYVTIIIFSELHNAKPNIKLRCLIEITVASPYFKLHRTRFPFDMLVVSFKREEYVIIEISLTVKAATLIFISGHGSAISSAKLGN